MSLAFISLSDEGRGGQNVVSPRSRSRYYSSIIGNNPVPPSPRRLNLHWVITAIACSAGNSIIRSMALSHSLSAKKVYYLPIYGLTNVLLILFFFFFFKSRPVEVNPVCSGLVYPRYQLISQQNKIFGGSFRRVFEYFFFPDSRTQSRFSIFNRRLKRLRRFQMLFLWCNQASSESSVVAV